MFIILIILLVLMVAGVPSLPWSERYGWGWGPSGFLGILLLILLLYAVLGNHPLRY